MPTLKELITALPGARWTGAVDVEVSGIAFDSRAIRAGDLFVAIQGQRHDATRFAPDAIRRGAVGVVAQSAPPPVDAPVVLVPDARRALPLLAAGLYGFPARRMGVVGITGTDGKTTTTHLISALLEAGGHPTGFISTVDIRIGAALRPNDSDHTTPEAPVVQRWLAEMVAAGTEYAAVEASSHALAMGRVDACEFDVGVFTNLAPEHLNFHGSLEVYRQDKARLFAMLGQSTDKGLPKAGVINADDAQADYFRAACPVPVVTYGIGSDADVTATDIVNQADGLRFRVHTPVGSVDIRSVLSGYFNVYNWLAAVAAALTQRVSLDQIAAAAPTVPPVPGRLQWIASGQPFAVVVDFAHTPQALETALRAVRPFAQGRVIAVFGHAGGRDPENRPRMGAVAASLADFSVITTDDPCDEDPAAISREVRRGAEEAGAVEARDFTCVLDRREAFRLALQMARPGDVVLLAGRGHEKYLPVGQAKLPFDDVEVARDLLRQLTGQA